MRPWCVLTLRLVVVLATIILSAVPAAVQQRLDVTLHQKGASAAEGRIVRLDPRFDRLLERLNVAE